MVRPNEFYPPEHGGVPTFTEVHEYEYYASGSVRYDEKQDMICKKGGVPEKLGKLLKIERRFDEDNHSISTGDFEMRKGVGFKGCFKDLTFEKEQLEQLARDAANPQGVLSLADQQKERDKRINDENLRGGRKTRRSKKRRATRRAKKHTRRSRS